MNYVQRNLVPLVVGLVAIAAIAVSTAVIVDRVRSDRGDEGRISDARLGLELGRRLGEAFDGAGRGARGATLGVQLDDGLTVTAVVSGSAAEQAGVKVGDQLLAVDGHDVKTLDDVRSQLAGVAANSDYQLKVSRDGKTTELTAHKGAALADGLGRFLEQMPEFGRRSGPSGQPGMPMPQTPSPLPGRPGQTPQPSPQPSPQGPRLGLSVVQVPGGLLVLTVQAGSAAEAAGVQGQDLLTAANGQPVPTIEALQKVLQSAGAGGTVTLTATRGGATVTLTAQLGQGTSAPRRAPAGRPVA